jgi:hypothetical protein
MRGANSDIQFTTPHSPKSAPQPHPSFHSRCVSLPLCFIAFVTFHTLARISQRLRSFHSLCGPFVAFVGAGLAPPGVQDAPLSREH